MPSKSKKQHNLMAAVANNPAFAKKVGIPKSVGEEFMKADKSKKFGSGGALKAVDSSDNPGLSKLPTEVRNKMGYMKKGGMAKKGMKEGGMMDKKDMAQDKKMAKKAVGMHEKQLHAGKKSDLTKLKKGGVAKTVTKEMEYDYKTGKKSFRGTTAQKDAHAEKEGKIVAKHAAYDKAMGMKKGGMTKGCGYASGGKVSQLSKANGIAVKGKTKGRIC
jgi:hypothetical protein